MPKYNFVNGINGASNYTASKEVQSVCGSSISLATDLTFVTQAIDFFIEVVKNMPPGFFPATLINQMKFETPASATETIVITSLQVTVEFLYKHLFNERYPTNPTPIQIEKINAIWVGIGHPENIITT